MVEAPDTDIPEADLLETDLPETKLLETELPEHPSPKDSHA